MPALPLTPQGIKMRIVGTNQGAPIAHVMHLQFTGSEPSLGDLLNIATSFRSSWNTNLASVIGTQTTYTLFEATDISSATGAVASNVTPVTGTRPGTTNPTVSVCYCLSWKIARHYRGGHPRTYIPVGTVTDIVNGKSLTPTFQGLAATAAASFLTSVNAITYAGGTVALCCVSYYAGHVLRAQGLTEPIIASTVHPRLDSQRRRLGKETP